MQRYFQLCFFLYARLWPLNAVFSLQALFFASTAEYILSAVMLAPIIKLGGYLGSLAIHYLFSSRTYPFYRNLGYSMRHLFAGSFFIDTAIFLLLFLIVLICRP
ncbi:hypothetical protein [Pedobacter sp. SYP-B3415]|uniref:hypothetical protein n=1 Tax=Pedobacter sp. SYP-B3415 TaxID=2496641 RepID=UPI00101BA870|nr:hypothetical protein [Pedobacter sp. SYP-B3415]